MLIDSIGGEARNQTCRENASLKNIQSIEKVQRRAACFVKKCNQRTPGTITSLLEELKWASFEQRRKHRKWHRGSRNSKLRQAEGSLRQDDVVRDLWQQRRQKERQTRNYHPLKFINAGCRTNIQQLFTEVEVASIGYLPTPRSGEVNIQYQRLLNLVLSLFMKKSTK